MTAAQRSFLLSRTDYPVKYIQEQRHGWYLLWADLEARETIELPQLLQVLLSTRQPTYNDNRDSTVTMNEARSNSLDETEAKDQGTAAAPKLAPVMVSRQWEDGTKSFDDNMIFSTDSQQPSTVAGPTLGPSNTLKQQLQSRLSARTASSRGKPEERSRPGNLRTHEHAEKGSALHNRNVYEAINLSDTGSSILMQGDFPDALIHRGDIHHHYGPDLRSTSDGRASLLSSLVATFPVEEDAARLAYRASRLVSILA